MDNDEVSIDLSIDTKEVEETIELIAASFQRIQATIDRIGDKIAKSLLSVTTAIQGLEKGIDSLSAHIQAIIKGLQSVADTLVSTAQVLVEYTLEISPQPADDFSTVMENTIGDMMSVVEAYGNILNIVDIIADGGGISAAIALGITALIALFAWISALIETHGDEIAAFFTETIPQMWSQFVAWLGDAITAIGTFFVDCWNGIVAVWENMPQWFQDFVIQPIVDFFANLWDSITTWATDAWNSIVDAFVNGATWFDENVIQPLLTFFDGLWTDITTWAQNAWTDIQESVSGIALWFDENVVQPIAGFFEDLWNDISTWAADAWAGIQEAFGSAWTWIEENIIDPISKGFVDMINGVIGFINGMLDGIVGGVNGIIRAINRLQFTVPDWVPEFGGQTVGFNLKELTAPQIPYLAKGAVLPANRPFLAVVGDQRHGTNVEAPLATIQEAVGLVMNDHISAMMAGFRALLEEQQATRRTIEGIEIGDRVIGEAAQRYQRKMAVTYGTF